MNNEEEIKKIEDIDDFILNFDKETKKIKIKSNRNNIFEILKIESAEIRHSNFLSWLFNSNEGHGLGNKVIFYFIKNIYAKYKALDIAEKNKNKYEFFNHVLPMFNTYNVETEIENIDILITSREEKFVICIENKIESTEHPHANSDKEQTIAYREKILEEYPKEEGYKHLFLYLSVNGEEPKDIDNWISEDYSTICNVLNNILTEEELLDNVKYLIESYIEILENNYVTTDTFKNECQEIYKKYRKVWEIIQENSTDAITSIQEEVKQYLNSKKDEVEICAGKRGLQSIEFYTQKMLNKLKTNKIHWYIDYSYKDEVISFQLWTTNFSKMNAIEEEIVKKSWDSCIEKGKTSSKDRYSNGKIKKLKFDEADDKMMRIIKKIVEYDWDKEGNNFTNLKREIDNIIDKD